MSQVVRIVRCAWIAFLLLATIVCAVPVGEVEPNDTPATGNALPARTTSTGAIATPGDQDYYAMAGLGSSWGFIALLDTTGSTDSQRGALAAFRADGNTLLRADTGSWQRGSGLALQPFVDGDAAHYLRVSEEGQDAAITAYSLRYYETVVTTQPEVEPNGKRTTGTPSSFTHEGVLQPAGDVDCFAFHGRAGDTILLALDGDPEGDGSPANLVLELVDPINRKLAVADVSGNGGQEFIEYEKLPLAGFYGYCIREAAGGGDPAATYRVGIVRNGEIYFPDYQQNPAWLDSRRGGHALVGDLLTFRLAITNTSPVPIPGGIRLTASFAPEFLSLVSTTPPASSTGAGSVVWPQWNEVLARREVYSVTLTLRACAPGEHWLYQGTQLPYYFTGTGSTVDYHIQRGVWLPRILRNAP